MLITALDILRENKPYRAEIVDPLQFANAGRISLLADVEQNAKEFVEDFLLDIDLPTPATVRIGNMRGFESVKDIKKATGYVVANVDFKTLSGHIIRIAFPIPVSRGFFYTPSVMNIDGKIKVFSADTIVSLVQNLETKIPTLNGIYTSSPSILHLENIERDLFTPPKSGIENRFGLDPV